MDMHTHFLRDDTRLEGFVQSREAVTLRRLEISEDMQRRLGFSPLGPANGPVKRAIFRENSAAPHRNDRRADLSIDRIAVAKAACAREGPVWTNPRYGHVTPPTA